MSSHGPVRARQHVFLSSFVRLLLGSAGLAGMVALGAGCSDEPTPSTGGGAGGVPAGHSGSSNVAGTNPSGGSAAVGGASAGSAGSAATAGASGSGMAGGGPAAGAGGGGSGGSGGSAGSGSGGGAAGAGSACAGKSYKLCEDFESGAGDAFPTGWTKFKGYGAGAASDVTMATDEFHSGKASVKSSSMAPGQTRIQKSIATLGATASKHWGRVFYKVQSPATKPASGVLHVTFVGLMGTGENRVVDTVEDSQGKHQWLYNNPDDQGGVGSPYDWTFDAAWHCAEWYIDVGTKSYRFFSDATEVKPIGFTGKNDSQMSNYSSIIVGAEFYQNPPTPFVMWFDDLALDDNQIGCK